ncbi:DJ-1/PfpI family protein [Alkalicoccus luteus]|uniref:DJ-1/PfpI family protein n=1 Tax=Alkalicoccus luteus TaxID=1237094 RepID=A0A969TUD3_9BACI|nr:DJ-1/PfpI family protein [Alkalicoccus luteus]NJP38588.1 DJ-1/PfpI family protein [Alkalicoccus luteus]
MTRKWKVGIYLFEDVEVLDFAGPYEVFSLAEDESGNKLFDVITLSYRGGLTAAKNGLRIETEKSIQACPPLDILIIPGGHGATDNEVYNKDLLHFVKQQAKTAELVMSVCTGAFILAEAELLNGREAVTHWMDRDDLQRAFPEVSVLKDTRFVDEGPVLTAAGISAGIDASLYTVGRFAGEDAKHRTAKRMEYEIRE